MDQVVSRFCIESGLNSNFTSILIRCITTWNQKPTLIYAQVQFGIAVLLLPTDEERRLLTSILSAIIDPSAGNVDNLYHTMNVK